MSDPIEKTELVIEIFHYAQMHSLDVNDKEDVKKVLQTIRADQSYEEDLEELMVLLQNADTFMEMTSRDITRKEKKQPN